jgi:hypothetical protein
MGGWGSSGRACISVCGEGYCGWVAEEVVACGCVPCYTVIAEGRHYQAGMTLARRIAHDCLCTISACRSWLPSHKSGVHSRR